MLGAGVRCTISNGGHTVIRSFHLKSIVILSVLFLGAIGNTTLEDGVNPTIDDGSKLAWCGITGGYWK